MIHHLKIYPEHFSAVLTGVKRAELRKNDRDFKVGDILHLMETPKGSCLPTGEFINAVVTHIADVGEWLPGYVMLSIERESGYAAPQLPQPTVDQKAVESLATDLMKRIDKITGERHSVATLSSLRVSIVEACRAAMLQGKSVKQPSSIKTSDCAGKGEDIKQASSNEPVSQRDEFPEGWVAVPVDMTPEQMRSVQLNSELGAYAAANLSGAYSLFREFWDVAIAAAPQQEVKP